MRAGGRGVGGAYGGRPAPRGAAVCAPRRAVGAEWCP
eukprot:gene49346-27649_t